VTKPVQLAVSYTLVALRTVANAVYTMFTRTTSSQRTRMFVVLVYNCFFSFTTAVSLYLVVRA